VALLDQLTTSGSVVIISNMKARTLIHERHVLDEVAFVEIRILGVPEPVRGSAHDFKYALAYVEGGQCRIRFDNEAGKGDHRHHHDGRESAYVFVSPQQLLADFWAEVDLWRAS
jgi:hypothetical protein